MTAGEINATQTKPLAKFAKGFAFDGLFRSRRRYFQRKNDRKLKSLPIRARYSQRRRAVRRPLSAMKDTSELYLYGRTPEKAVRIFIGGHGKHSGFALMKRARPYRQRGKGRPDYVRLTAKSRSNATA